MELVFEKFFAIFIFTRYQKERFYLYIIIFLVLSISDNYSKKKTLKKNATKRIKWLFF